MVARLCGRGSAKGGVASWLRLLVQSCDGLIEEFGHSDEIVGCDRECEDRIGLGGASDLELCKPGLSLHPTEHFLDALATDLADAISDVAGGATVDRASAHNPMLGDAALDRNMRRHAALAQVFDKVGDVKGFVASKRDAAAAFAAVEHGKSCFAFRNTGCVGQGCIGCEPIALLPQHMAHEAQPALAAIRLAIEPCVRVRGRGMRLVRSLFLVEVTLAVAAKPRRLARAVLRPEALHRLPRANQRAVD